MVNVIIILVGKDNRISIKFFFDKVVCRMTHFIAYFKSVYFWVLCFLIAGLLPVAIAGTIFVDVNDPGCVSGTGQPDPYSIVYCGIQDAIDDAANSDTIQVSEGTYIPAGGRIILDKMVWIRADPALAVEGPGPQVRPIIQTNHAGWTTCAVQIAADYVIFDGLEVDNTAAGGISGYIVGDYDIPYNGWTVRNCDIHNGRNCIRPVGDNVTIDGNNLHETESDLINAEYGICYGLTVRYNWLHSHHTDSGAKPAGVTYTCSSYSPGNWADVTIMYNYCWASRTFVDFQNWGGLSPANTIRVAHNTVDWWIGDLPDPPEATDLAQQMSLAWWSGAGNWNAPNFEIRDNLFSRQKWYTVVDTDMLLLGQLILERNLFWQWYLVDEYYPAFAYPNEWPGARGAVGWEDMGAGNEFVMVDCFTEDPLYSYTGTTADEYYALSSGLSPAYQSATDGLNIGAWQGSFAPTATPTTGPTETPSGPTPTPLLSGSQCMDLITTGSCSKQE